MNDDNSTEKKKSFSSKPIFISIMHFFVNVTYFLTFFEADNNVIQSLRKCLQFSRLIVQIYYELKRSLLIKYHHQNKRSIKVYLMPERGEVKFGEVRH